MWGLHFKRDDDVGESNDDSCKNDHDLSKSENPVPDLGDPNAGSPAELLKENLHQSFVHVLDLGFLTRAFPEVWWTFKTFILKLNHFFS